ncbi:MAG: hypothetical protein AVDCRST_MAG36-1021, partial [uncultured Nocardioidaceae bacterium]
EHRDDAPVGRTRRLRGRWSVPFIGGRTVRPVRPVDVGGAADPGPDRGRDRGAARGARRDDRRPQRQARRQVAGAGQGRRGQAGRAEQGRAGQAHRSEHRGVRAGEARVRRRHRPPQRRLGGEVLEREQSAAGAARLRGDGPAGDRRAVVAGTM